MARVHQALPPDAEAVPTAQHFRVEAKMGMKPVLRCTLCGASIPFASARGPNSQVNREVRSFAEQHSECRPHEDNAGATSDADITQAH